MFKNFFFVFIFTQTIFSCSDQNGGAVEIAWVIRGSNQKALSCDEKFMGNDAIDKIKISVVAYDGTYAGQDLCDIGIVKHCIFDCSSGYDGTMRGVTDFSVPEGTYFIGLHPLRRDGTVISTEFVQTPSSVKKDLKNGELTFMGVWQLVINLSAF